jgi:hypothetical protein
MSDAVEVFDHNGGRYVREADYLDLQQQHTNLKNVVSGFVDQVAEQGIAQRRIRRRTANLGAEGVAAGDWQVTKIHGPGFSTVPGAEIFVQIYRIDCGPQQQHQQQDQQAEVAPVRYLFRPRDAMQLLRTYEQWMADKVGALDNRVSTVAAGKVIDVGSQPLPENLNMCAAAAALMPMPRRLTT